MDDCTENASDRAAPANTAVVTLVENFIVIYKLDIPVVLFSPTQPDLLCFEAQRRYKL
jgi:hypothetical protein